MGFSTWIKYGPWIAIGLLVVGLSWCLWGLSEEMTKRTQAEEAVKGAATNLSALELALKNKDRKLVEAEARRRRSGCDGTWIETESPDGTIRRECIGKTSVSEDSSRTRDSNETTPDIKSPYQDPAGAAPASRLRPLGFVILADLGLPDRLGSVSWAAGPTWSPGSLKLPLIPEVSPSLGLAVGWGPWGLRVLALVTGRFGSR